ncbi:hypothetical protein [Anaeromyxobacter sp. K]|uniref:hypothetical protein n=1 Tax=Anaeromyxobacter sp. (strain K) TaxID=447217 RepID=UPI0012FAF6D4|nr:hypothetical protein [Anaeromyxobacter sp. K]
MPRLHLAAAALALACSRSASSSASPCDLQAAAVVPAGFEIRWPAAGDRRPAMNPPMCFPGKFRPPSGFRAPAGVVEYLLRFAVLADGRLAGFEMLPEGTEPELACGVWKALKDCAWTAGRDTEGRPAAFWVKVPMRIRTEGPSGH